jgi:hypothetical protein
MATNRVSTTSVAADAPLAFYSNSPENTDVASNYKVVIPGNTVGALYLSSSEMGYNETDGVTVVVEDANAAAAAAAEGNKSITASTAPSLSDIQVVSKNVVYDASGNPSVEVVFKIKNSSGKTLKAINARVELL